MKALLLAAGKASRLGELSTTTPKCLHRVGDEVLLDRIVRQLRDVGVNEFLINTHHLADRIVQHIHDRADSQDFTIVYEPELLGTLGTLRANADYFGSGPGWVLHADNFIEGSLKSLATAFASRGNELWGNLLTFYSTEPSTCGIVVTDEQGIMIGFHEKSRNPPGAQASAATFLFSSRVFDFIRNQSPYENDISRHLLPQLTGKLSALAHQGAVIDIGTPQGLLTARRMSSLCSDGGFSEAIGPE